MILITRKLDDSIYQKLSQLYDVDEWSQSDEVMPRAELLRRAAGKDGILCTLTDKIDEELLRAAGDNLQTISTLSVGYDHVDVAGLQARGITLGYTPDVLTSSVADITIGLMINAARRLPEAAAAVKNGEWGAWSPDWMTGRDLSGATVGLLGMGKIAQAVAARLRGFDCRVLYYSRTRKPEIEASHGVIYRDRDSLLRESDFVSVHTPLTVQTTGMCDDAFFDAMKQTTVFINTSRGGLVDHDALHRALQSGSIYAAGLDVTTPEPLPSDHPLVSTPNCIILPHIGSASIQTRQRMSQIAAANLMAGLGDGEFISKLV